MKSQKPKLTTATALALLVAGAAAHAAPAEEPVSFEANPWNRPMGITLEARSVQQEGAFGMYLVHPIFHSPSTTILLEGYGFEGEQDLGLAGGGAIYRRAISSRSNFEASFFFEGLRSADNFSYPQVGAGLAWAPDRWITLRANGYLPLSGGDSRPGDTQRWSETEEDERHGHREAYYERSSRKERAPMRGFEVETEFRLPQPPRWIDPRLAIGYSYREAESLPQVYAGPTVRGELHIAKHWVAEAEWRRDTHGADQEWRFGVRFEMLLGAEANDLGAEDERYLPVRRFPWPTVARSLEVKKARRTGYGRIESPKEESSHDPSDCCNSDSQPLIFN